MVLLDWVAQKPPWIRILLKSLLILLIGILDHFTGAEIAFSIFYLVPVATTAWIDGKAAGFFVSFVCSAAWLTADLTAGHEYTQSWIPVWNMFVRMGFFVIIAFILARLKADLDREKEMARVDGLTQIWNARYFLELLQREIERCGRSGRPLTLAFIDLDNFKQVNDTLGHSGGDQLLRAVGARIRQELRSTDISGRMGGDEFAIAIPEADFNQASVVLRRVKDSLDQMIRTLNSPVSVSLGAITFPTPNAPAEAILKAADDLMYQVKRNGKNAIRHELAGAPPPSPPGPGETARQGNAAEDRPASS